MTRLTHTLLLAAVAAGFTAPASAQGLHPVEGGDQPIQDLEGWLDESTIPDAPSPTQGGDDPLAPSAPAPEPELTPEERAKRQRQIERNYGEAEKIYEGIINADPVEKLDRRISNNERIVKEYQTRIRGAAKERRELQVSLYNRTFYLKQQVEQGKLTREGYERMITEEERKYRQRSAVLKEHYEAWKEELAAAQTRLRDLQSQRQMLLAQRPRALRGQRGKKAQRQARPGEALVGSLQQRLQKLGRFNTRHTMDGVHPRELGFGGGGSMTGLGSPTLGGAHDAGATDPFADDFDDDLDMGGGPNW